MRLPFWLFIIFPFLEMLVLIKVGELIGALNAIALVVLGMLMGAAIIRKQGLKTALKARERMISGELPALEMIEGFMIAIGGVSLIFPGFISDLFGVGLLIPPLRKWVVRKLLDSGKWKVQEANRTYEGQYYRDDVNQSHKINQTIDSYYEKEKKKK